MLVPCQILTPGEVRTCQMTGKKMIFGDWYYQDTENPNYYVRLTEYNKIMKNKKEQTFDYSLLDQAKSEAEYAEMLEESQKQYLYENILDVDIITNGDIEQREMKGLFDERRY